MQHIVTGARIVLGLIFVVFGLNGFFNFMPTPEMNEEAASFMGALMATGYLMVVEKGIEVVAGLMLLTGRFVPLGLVLLAPLTVNILLFHLFLDMGGLPVAIVVVVLNVFLAWAYRDSFRSVLQPDAKPVAESSPVASPARS
jgi:uncharacterized membrane protein YphA (DoxX/SURF4 family)